MEWIQQKPAVPANAGWYRVMIHGDSESVDGHTIYDYSDYETWAYWQPAEPDELEDFDGGYKGTWQTTHDEEGEWIFAYCGPVEVPAFKQAEAKRRAANDTRFDELTRGRVAWLGHAPDQKTILCEMGWRCEDGGLFFTVSNGNWSGKLHEQFVIYEGGREANVLYIVDERGERHEPVYVVDIREPTPKRVVLVGEDEEVPF